MSILINKDTKILVQGLTGSQGSLHARLCKEYCQTQIVGGVTPGKGNTSHEGVPVYNTVQALMQEQKVDCSLVFVPPSFCQDAIFEAIDAGIELIITITEGIPVIDMLNVMSALKGSNSRLIGPNCPGVITPGQCKVGIMPGAIHKAGPVGVVSRSGTLTYEAVAQLTAAGLGQSSCVGIGGDPIPGTRFVDILQLFEQDKETTAVVLIGEIGGTAEEEAAEFIKQMTKPVVAFIAGQTAPPGRRMGHAGAIVAGSQGTAKAKIEILEKSGVTVAANIAEIGETMKSLLTG